MDKEMTITGDTVKVVPLKYFYFVLKRVADVLISFIGILFLVPLMIFVKVLYLLSGDFHSIFYRQKRLGKHGKEIRIFKFRTMVVNAEEILEDWLKNNPEKRKEYLRDRKIDNDPTGLNIEPCGIPSSPFIYVPFSMMPAFRNLLISLSKFLSLRPGLTGYWASHGRSNTTYKERIKMELYYIDHCGILLDLKIIFKTFIAVFKKDGAK